MKTRKVFNDAGHAHELTFSCHRRMPLLNRDRTRRWVLDALEFIRTEHNVALLAYVIMPEHMHVLLMLRETSSRIEDVQRSFKQSVSRNALYWLRQNNRAFLDKLAGDRAGDRQKYHFWLPGGGYDRNIDNPTTARKVIDYIHANPVRRGLAATEVDWPWSSARYWQGLDDYHLPMDRDLL